MGKRVLQWMLLLLFVESGLASCPSSISKSCFCEEHMRGLDVTCQQIGTDLNAFLESFEFSRIDRLTVIQSSWPVLERVVPVEVRSLRLIDCKISQVEDEAFLPIAETLEELVIVNNSLTKFPILGLLPRLHMLSFSYNKLMQIPENAFDGISHLRQLRLEGNQIHQLPSGLLSTIKTKLDLLDISGNRLSRVPTDMLRNCVNLMYLDLSDNQIRVVDSLDFKNLPKLKELRLNGNHIRSVEPLAFKNVPQVQYLYLQRNSLPNVDSFDFVEKFRRLEILDVSYNFLTKVPCLNYHESIRQVKLDYNRIRGIDSHTFNTIPKLQLISLQNNEIESVAENSFFALDHLTILLLENNFIRKLGRGMLSGIRSLQQLDLRNNSLSELQPDVFLSTLDLKMIDLSHNKLKDIPTALFPSLNSVIWLNLSQNSISFLEKGTFARSISHIFLVGNPWHCDEKIEWFVKYLVSNRIRTHLPMHQQATCASPKQYAGLGLLNFVADRAEASSKLFNDSEGNEPGSSKGRVSSGMGKVNFAIEDLKSNPAEDVPKAEIKRGKATYIPTNSQDAITGEKTVVSPKIDLSSVPPEMLIRILRGESIPGVPEEVMESSCKDYLLKMYETASNVSDFGSPLDKEKQITTFLEEFPKELVADIMKGKNFSYLSDEQFNVIKEYYQSKLAQVEVAKEGLSLTGIQSTPELLKLIKSLSSNYDPRNIPEEIIQSISRGEIPDFELLPADIQKHFITNFQNLFAGFIKGTAKVEDFIRRTPKFERKIEITTFSPISVDVPSSNDCMIDEGEFDTEDSVYYYALLLICLVAVISAIVVGILCYYRKRRQTKAATDKSSYSNFHENSFVVSTLRTDRSHLRKIQMASNSPEIYCTPVCDFPRAAPRRFL